MVTLLFLLAAALTDYDADLKKLQAPAEDPVKRAVALYRHASLTVDFNELREAETAIDHAIEVAPSPDLIRLRANFNFKMHRLDLAKQDVPPDDLLAAQIAMQLGDYEAARIRYEAVAAKTHSWDSIASLTYYMSVTGDPAAADRLYAEAEEEITAKEMRSYAWVEVQRGVLDYDHRRYEDALLHYERAEK